MNRPLLSEAAFQEQVIDLAHLYGWLIHHCRAALNARGRYAVPIQGNPGFPDLVLARSGRIIFAELKNATNKLSPYQVAWRNAITGLGVYRVEWYCWRPDDLDDVRRALERPQTDWCDTQDVPTAKGLL